MQGNHIKVMTGVREHNGALWRITSQSPRYSALASPKEAVHPATVNPPLIIVLRSASGHNVPQTISSPLALSFLSFSLFVPLLIDCGIPSYYTKYFVYITITIMSSSTRSQQASIDQLSLGEKLSILPSLAISCSCFYFHFLHRKFKSLP